MIYLFIGFAALALALVGLVWMQARRRAQQQESLRREAEAQAALEMARAIAAAQKKAAPEPPTPAPPMLDRPPAPPDAEADNALAELQAILAAEEAHRAAARQAEAERQAEVERLAALTAARAAAEAAAAAAREAERRAAEEAARAAAAPPTRELALHETRVMVVDDSKIVRVKTSRVLAPLGYQVELAESAEEAIEKMAAHTPHVLITDVEMPGMDGFGLTRYVREHPGLRDLPVVMITSSDDKKDEADAAGVTTLLGKPYEEAALIACIEAARQAVRVPA